MTQSLLDPPSPVLDHDAYPSAPRIGFTGRHVAEGALSTELAGYQPRHARPKSPDEDEPGAGGEPPAGTEPRD